MSLFRPGGPVLERRVAATLSGVVLAMAITILMAPSPALGAPAVRGPGFATSATYLGIEVIDGVPTVCIDSSAATPSGLQPGTEVSDPGVAYLLDRYATTTSNTTAAALAYIVKKKYDSNRGAADRALGERPEEPQIRAAIDRLTADAARSAGPYSTSPRIQATTGTVPTKGTVTGIGVRQTDGSYAALSGVRIAMTLSGPAAFDSTGTTTLIAPSTALPQSAPWHATGEGAVSVTATATGLPPTTFVVHRKQAPGYQRVVSAATTPGTATGRARLTSPVVSRYFPTAETQIQASAVLGSARSVPISDRVSVSHAQPGSTVAVTVIYYWTPDRPARSTTVPANAVGLGTFDVKIRTGPDGTGTDLAPGPQVAQPHGWVSAVESIAATTTSAGYRSDFGVASESIQLPARPVVETTIQSQPVSPGIVELVDAVKVTGAFPNSTVGAEVSFYLDRTKPGVSSSVPTTATLVGTAQVLVGTDATGTGTAIVRLPGVKVTGPSWAVGMERIPAVAATATTPAVVAYQAPYAQSTESTQLCAPVPSTQLQAQVLTGASTVRLVDRVAITHACANSTVRVVVPFYLDASRPGPGPTVPTSARLIGTATAEVVTDAHGDGVATVTGPDVHVPAHSPVWAVGMERIDGIPGTPTAPGTVGAQAPYGQATETVQIAPPGTPIPVAGAAHSASSALVNAGVPTPGRGQPLLAGAGVLALAAVATSGVAIRRRGRHRSRR
jgi:hypothetical protein